MGLIDIDRIPSIITNCSKRLKLILKSNLYSMSEEYAILILVILSQFIYAKYSKYGIIKNNNKVEMLPSYIRDAFKDIKFYNYAVSIITLRNKVCHDYGSEDTNVRLEIFKDETDKLKEFLEFVLEEDKQESSLDKLFTKAKDN